MASKALMDRASKLMVKAKELGVSTGALEFYFATGKRYKGGRACGYGKPEEPVNECSSWDELPRGDIIKEFKEDE